MSVTRVLTALLALAPPALAAEAPRASVPLADDMLAVHNELRAEFGQAPLQWDAALEADAASHARLLASLDRMAHGRDKPGAEPQGENLWMGSRGAFTARQMAGSWAEERSEFIAGRFPDVSRTLGWQEVGHFTQMIWHATRRLGCALASSERHDFLVCRYTPAGNYEGENPLGR
jgi:uncharacterized protein YkwD